jgi:soluble lytic murein transglycosylase-like protein
MKLAPILISISCLAVSTAAQNAPRVFDNFDTSGGVKLILPPKLEPIARTTRKKVGGKWVVVVKDPLVKKTGSSKWVVSVEDGLAAKNAARNTAATRLIMGSSPHLKGFTTGNTAVDSYIVDSSRRYGIDPLLIYSQMHQESTFKASATSYKGASGLMQLMPATARRFGVTKIYDPQQNIEGGVKYMRWLLDTFNGDLMLALAGYNAGEGAVMKYGWQIPPYRETQEYVRRITARYNSISNPRYVQTAKRVTNAQAAQLEAKESAPLNIYEPDPLAVRLPSGRMILVNQ